jgi:hypothetical protein
MRASGPFSRLAVAAPYFRVHLAAHPGQVPPLG